jgi:Raf kinase inhibitor-like YbhB/YbcL family protein
VSPPAARRGPRAAAVSAALLLALTGCDTGDGRGLEPPPPGATAPPLATSTTTTIPVPVGQLPAPTLTFTSPAFVNGTAIPARFSCDGEDLSPPVAWDGVPPDAAELAIVVHDPDAPGGDFLHWLVAGIDPAIAGFGEGGLPETAIEVRPWTGPCPPAGDTHRYEFVLYALPTESGVVAEADPAEARVAIETAYLQAALFTGTYGRP